MAGCPCMVRLEALCAHPGPGGFCEFAWPQCRAEREPVRGLGPGLVAW